MPNCHTFKESLVIGKNCEIPPMTSLGTDGYGDAHDEQFNHYRHLARQTA